MANIYGFPDAHDLDDSITKEVIIRTWCSLYMIDQWSSAGLNLPRQIEDDQKRPVHEIEFWRLKPEVFFTPSFRAKALPSLWGHMVDLAQMFGRVKDFHEELAEGSMNEHDTELTTYKLKERFDEFTRLKLPLEHHYTPRTFKTHAAAGLGGTFVALHLGYHHYATLLYFPYLDPQLTQIPGRSSYVDLCKSHAASFSDLLRTSHETPNCEAVYLIVAHMTVVSSSVLLHTLLFGEEDELSEARRRLYSNFEILLKLKQYWPGADFMVKPRMVRFGQELTK
ncbi:hypothetical protein N7448_006491 [Penicillium atrosanguineum]|uniref:Transcription factor domain-containing protein n=1 Tax=Penicillium atrosanguineum TaxID=1132637 RepID=A0A9W9U1Q8_9EURO|nr:Ribosome biogenesis protein RLP24 [Penicillium atrosanguineum]KAJ5132333.1 hypothetical protein N7448_006491 [Penicillium atrosanguineum]KAJ5137454.1 hypothetical protein N7526_003687 [Penicillium atrosanguineum]KAJ5290000.1 Ribosome biogenesis protein RLP24 [Penicillium atrosanguineum]KAJ5307822.1 hypothetical protein N7476_008478 [Penicillium atrosanguineum]